MPKDKRIARIEVRLPQALYNKIRRIVLRQKEQGTPGASANRWILDACIQRLEAEGKA